MPDVLTPEERAAIAAFPAGRIQRIPRGVSGLQAWVWDEKSERIVDPNGLKWTPWGVKKRKTPKPPKKGLREKNREINASIDAMWRDGAKSADIAAVFGISAPAVLQRVSKMRARGLDLPRRIG